MWNASEASAKLNLNLMTDGTKQVNYAQYCGHH